MTPADWQAYISIGKDIVTAGAAITAIVVALKGLQAWRKQLRGKIDYELARRFLRAVYRVRDSLQAVRHPVQSASEITHALKDGSTSLTANNVAADGFIIEQAVYNVRWKKVH